MKSLLALSLVSLALLVSPPSEADQLSTTFEFTLAVGSVKTEIGPTSQNSRIVLPSNFSHWNCQITPRYISDDGTGLYHNIACVNTMTADIVGVSINCLRMKPDTDYERFFLRNGGADVSFTGFCATRSASKPAVVSDKNL